ncbi:thiamine pyrophosphate-binding protein [candidate division WOR-3 bacterium]|nr:thiamine pyrophosphate-binding protein [candidate division WOR-3 bacterium]
MLKVSDYIARRLADQGIRHVFMLTGGGAMHLNDSFGQEKRMQYVCCHHEQAAAMAAEGYARTTDSLGVVNVTTGPGGINALNGVFGAWTDSVPMLVLSGQVKRETCLCVAARRQAGALSGPNSRTPEPQNPFLLTGLRQLGDQEADIIPIVSRITKYAAFVADPQTIRYHLDRALFLARSGRPGPCWLDVPLDVQSALVDEGDLRPYDEREDRPHWDLAAVRAACGLILERLQNAERPVILAGNGIHCARAEAAFRGLVQSLGIPVALSRTARDLLGSDDPLYCGRAGIDADRAGNFTVQNADLLLVLGSRLGIRQVSYNWQSFARNAYKVQVDADPAELDKPTLRPDLPILCDLAVFFQELSGYLGQSQVASLRPRFAEWLAWCRQLVSRYPGVLPEMRAGSGLLNPYHFCEHLSRQLSADDVVVCGNGSAFIIMFQAGRVKQGQRWFFNSGCASMGYDLPAAVGAALARGGKRVICLAGDGSIQLNLQELQTVVHHHLPVKTFVLNNNGYLSIRQTQQAFFGRLVGESPSSGVSFPDMVKVAEAYGLPAWRVERANLKEAVARALDLPGPALCDVVVDPDQGFEPRLASRQLPDGRIISPDLADMFPFLSREELESNLWTTHQGG